MEIILVIIAGCAILVLVCIIAIIIRCYCNRNSPQPTDTYPHFDAASIPPNYGYTSSQAHQKSSWACTFKGGQQQQVNTHIWETPLPEPNEGEYTLPASMKKQLYANAGRNMQGGQTLPPQMTTSRVSHVTESDYTMPSSMQTMSAGHCTMPTNMKQENVMITSSTNSDYTIPVLPHPIPDSPDSESEYTMPTTAAACHRDPDQVQDADKENMWLNPSKIVVCLYYIMLRIKGIRGIPSSSCYFLILPAIAMMQQFSYLLLVT